MSDLKKQKLSDAMIKDFKDFARTGKDSIFWLAKGENVTIDDVITRMQSANILTVAKLGVKTADEWKNSRPSRKVRDTVSPITNNGGYSSFALIENENNYGKLRYPLVASFASSDMPFETKTFPIYSSLIKKIRSSYKVKVIEKNDSGELFVYKRKSGVVAKLKNVGLGALNLCRKIVKKQILKSSPSYKGKIVLNSSIEVGNNKIYKFSEQEKMTRILFELIKVTSKDYKKKGQLTLDSKVMAYVNLYASVLVSRAINYGSEKSNRMVEASLSLQMCNTLAGLNLDSQTLKSANSLAMKTALFTIDKLGISKQDVMESMMATGYKYYIVPQTIEEALAPKRPFVNENTFVYDAENTLGVQHFAQVTYKNSEKTEPKHEEKSEKVEKDALDNPPPPDVIEAPYYKDDSKDYSKDKSKDDSSYVEETKHLASHDELDDLDMVNWADNYGKTRYKGSHEGVKTTNVYLTKRSAEKYIDKVVLSAVTNNIDSDVKKISEGADTKVATQRAKRRYNFLEHIYTYYDRNKLSNAQTLQQSIDKELDSAVAGDNVYAHSYAKSIIDLRHNIVDEIFGNDEKILKPEGKEIAAVVNDYTQNKYNSKLSTYVKGAMRKCLKTVFKEIDSKSFEQKNLVEPESSK